MSNAQQEQMFNIFLSILNVSSIEEARKLPSESVIKANALQIRDSPYGTYSYGITVDGDIVPALPPALFATGRYDKTIEVMMGHNANEGITFTSPFITDDSALEPTLREIFPTITQGVLNYITQTLYPPIYNGSKGYTDLITRASRIRADAIIISNICTLNEAYPNSTFSYKFNVEPPLHGFDVQYTLYDGGGVRPLNLQELTGMASPPAALTLQKWITNFVRSGDPEFPRYGEDRSMVELVGEGVRVGMDDYTSGRCKWWGKGLYFEGLKSSNECPQIRYNLGTVHDDIFDGAEYSPEEWMSK